MELILATGCWIRGIKAAQSHKASSLGMGKVLRRKMRSRGETSCKGGFRLLCKKLQAKVMFLEILEFQLP